MKRLLLMLVLVAPAFLAPGDETDVPSWPERLQMRNTATHFLVWRLTGLERTAQLGIWEEDDAKQTPDWEKWANQKPAQVVVTGIPEAVKAFSWPLNATPPVRGSANSP